MKKTNKLSRIELKKALNIATSKEIADILIKNVRILDLVNGDIFKSCIVISNQTIAGIGLEYENASAKEIIDAKNAIAVPGFIDGHLHIESSLMSPFEFERLTLPLGTTTVICDPHEITNVLGDEGFSWFLRASENMYQNMFVQVSSCVPALPGFETNGSDFKIEQMKKYHSNPSVLGLAEMMNFPAVINGNDEVLDKIEAFEDLNLDGHSPLLRGKDLNAYLCAGIQNCHETISRDEGKEKLQKGMSLIIREGSVAKNLKTLAPLVTEFNSPQCFLCTDDRNPYEILHEGHINYLIKKMISELNIPPHVAYRLSSFSAAKHFNLKRLGLIAPGKKADIVLLSDLNNVIIQDVLISGKLVSTINFEREINDKINKSLPPLKNTIQRKPITINELNYNLKDGIYNVIKIIHEEIITEHLKVEYQNGNFKVDDIHFMANIERYGKNISPGLGLVNGTGLKSGAFASSVAHDSHNIIVIGKTLEDMVLAVNTIIKNNGGFVVVDKNEVKAELALPIAGLISLESGSAIEEKISKLKIELKNIGVTLSEPFIQMAFLALPVIPSLKLTDKGLFDVNQFKFISLCDE